MAVFFSVLFIMLILIFPEQGITGAKEGLMLWFQTIIPVLFPFALATSTITAAGVLNKLSPSTRCSVFGRLPIPPAAIYCLFTGMLCGFPLGAKTAADACGQKLLDKPQGQLFAAIANNPGPMYLNGYVITTCLGETSHRLFLMSAVYAAPVLWGFFRLILLRLYRPLHPQASGITHTACVSSAAAVPFNFNTIITDTCELMLRIGTFIIIFAIIGQFFMLIPLPDEKYLFSAIFEITNGAKNIIKYGDFMSRQLKTALLMALTASGGICITFQTYTVIHQQGLSLKIYICDRLAIAAITGLIVICGLSAA